MQKEVEETAEIIETAETVARLLVQVEEVEEVVVEEDQVKADASTVAKMVTGQETVLMKGEEISASTVDETVTWLVNAEKEEEQEQIDTIHTVDQAKGQDQDQDQDQGPDPNRLLIALVVQLLLPRKDVQLLQQRDDQLLQQRENHLLQIQRERDLLLLPITNLLLQKDLLPLNKMSPSLCSQCSSG